MTRQEVLDQIEKLQQVNLADLYSFFECTAKNSQKRLYRILTEYLKEKIIRFDQNTKKYSIIKKEPPKSKPVQPQITEKKWDLNNFSIKKKKKEAVQDFDSIIEKYHIRKDFPPSAMREAESINITIPDIK